MVSWSVTLLCAIAAAAFGSSSVDSIASNVVWFGVFFFTLVVVSVLYQVWLTPAPRAYAFAYHRERQFRHLP